MTARRPDRRLFLALIGSLLGAGAGAWAWAAASDQPAAGPREPPAAPATIPRRPTTTRPAATTSTGQTSTALGSVPLTVLCREAWGARPAGDGLARHVIERLTVHHTAVQFDDRRVAARRLRGYQTYHMDDRGWPDIAYHFLVDLDGHVFEGRDPAYRGDTATEYDPTGHFLVCLDGHYDTQEPSPAQLAATADILAYATVRYDVDPATLGGHRDYASTSCPGAAVQAVIDDGSLLAAVRSRLADARIELDRVCGPDAEDIITAIEAGPA